MYFFNSINENEYKICSHDKNIWKYSRKNPININSKNNGNCFFYKNTLRNQERYFGEVIGSKIAQETIKNACTAELAKKRRNCYREIYDNGVISYYYLSNRERTISMHCVLDEYFLDKNIGRKSLLRSKITIDTIIKALNSFVLQKKNRPYRESQKLIQQYIDMVIFDCRFGNYDRNLDNWLLYENIDTKEISLYPLFDNEVVLGFSETSEKYCYTPIQIIEECKSQRMRYVVPNEQYPQCVFLEKIVKYLLSNYPKETASAIKKVSSFSLSDLTKLLNQFPDISNDRKKFCCKMFYARKILFDRYNRDVINESKKCLKEGQEKEI